MLSKKEKLEIIIPIYNEQECIDKLIERLLLLKERLTDIDVGVIFVNDGSTDRSLDLLTAYCKNYKFIKLINFSRNFGHQVAVTAGIDYADADYVAIIDADLQDPPELIEEMIKKIKEGFDVVYGQRMERKGETFFKKITAKIFYRMLSKLCDVEIPKDTGDFRVFNRKVLMEIKKLREKHRFLRGMIPWIGFKSTPFLYNRDSRFAGQTKYPFKKMLKFALDAIFSFSNTPLRLASYIGNFIILIGIIGALLMLYLRFFTKYTVPGITAVILTIIIMSGVQIIMLGIIGEYVGRIFEEVKGRPLYIVEKTMNIENGENSEN
jgi:glycosyltransferase involved in cell wall biosynthesis